MQSNYSGSLTEFAVLLQIQCQLLLLLLSPPRSECPKLLNAHLLLHSSMTSPCFPNTWGTFTDSYLLMLLPLPEMTCVYFSTWRKSTHSSRSFLQHYHSLEGSLDTLLPRDTLWNSQPFTFFSYCFLSLKLIHSHNPPLELVITNH